MSEYSIHAMRVDPAKSKQIYESLKNNGEGRFGWSYIESANLIELKQRLIKQGHNSLSPEEHDCFQRFLLEIKEEDYVIYINVPKWGECTIARVTGPYFWRYDDTDFNHRFLVDRTEVFTFDRNDEIVEAALSARLKLQQRHWRIYTIKEFRKLLAALKDGQGGKKRSLQTSLRILENDIRSDLLSITEKTCYGHPGKDFEGFLAMLFTKMPGVKEVQHKKGRADHGADIIVVYEEGLDLPGLLQQKKCLVQAKAYSGNHVDTRAIQDIRRAFEEYPDADMGLIISTAIKSSEKLETELDKLRRDIQKPIGLVIGEDVAVFFMKYGAGYYN